MTTYSDTSIVRIPPLEEAPPERTRGVEAWPGPELGSAGRPRAERRRSVASITTLALAAGIGALGLGVLALVLAATSGDSPAAPTAAPAASAGSSVTAASERRALALLAKPSTERLAFRQSRGELLLAVGSGGKGAIIVQGLDRAPAQQPYQAWLIGAGKPVRVARFTGAERVVFLTAGVPKGATIAVAKGRVTALEHGPERMIATR